MLYTIFFFGGKKSKSGTGGEKMKKTYLSPKAEIVAFEKQDVITSSGFLFDWNLPSIDLGGEGWQWSENGDSFDF